VDDRPQDLAALESILSDLGDPILRASSGQKALEILLEADVAVILLDMRMPEMDGLETARYIRQGKRSRLTPIIFVTAADDDVAGMVRGYSAGAVDYIQKPVQSDILRSKVRVFADLYSKRRELAEQAAALALANRDLERAYRDLEIFTYAIAHELRAPLRAMFGFSQILREDYAEKPLDGKGLNYAQKIEGGALRMDTLIRDLLAYCNVARSSGTTVAVDSGRVVQETLVTFGPMIHMSRADVSVSDTFPAVLGDPSLLALSLSCFLSNALKFSPPGAPPKIRIDHEEKNGRVRLRVEDRGVGIHPDHQERIFRVFERLSVSGERGGSGIGLAIAKAAAERMGGSVGVWSEPGKGSRFWIELAECAGVPI
jgi:signal transduction histidine kinase